MEAPLVVVFVRHSAKCPYRGDEFNKRCRCKKHLRYSLHGKQYRKKTGSRSWTGAEEKKRQLEDQLAGRAPAKTDGLLLADAIETFRLNKESEGLKPRVLNMYKRELKRLLPFSEARSLFTVTQALTIENLIALRATWPATYKSSYSRSVVQKHLNHFLRFCFNAGWIERIPRLSPIKTDDAPETLPLTEQEYAAVLKAASGKTAILIKLMRWSGLAIRDASTLKRADLQLDREKNLYRILRERTKTGSDLYIPIPKDVAEELLTVANGNKEFVFWNRQNGHSSEYRHAGYMGEQIAAAFERAGVQSDGHMISHRLRATFAVDLLQKGVPLEHVSKLLGHKSVKTTEMHYAKWVKGRQDQLDSIVSAAWRKA